MLRDCAHRGSKAVLTTRTIRIFSMPVFTFGGDYPALYACLARRRVAYFIGYDECISSGVSESGASASSFKPAGRFLGYISQRCDDFDSYHWIRVIDLETGRLRRDLRAMPGAFGGNEVSAFVVKRNASVAWIAEGSVEVETGPRWAIRVSKSDGRSPTTSVTLDGPAPGTETGSNLGTSISPRSLRLNRSRRQVTWLSDGKRRSARIR